MSVITISGQVGAGEQIVAHRVAESLGYRLVDRPVILEVLKQYGIVEYEKLLDTPPHLFDGLADEKRSANDFLNVLYLLFARRGRVVILSRRAFLSLEPFLNAFTVFLKSSVSERVKNIMRWEHLDEKGADEFIRDEEEKRKGIIESLHNRKLNSMDPWSLIVDVHKLGMDKVVDIIVEANKKISEADEAFGWQDGIPTTDTIETDSVMERAVDKVLSA